MMLTCRGGRRRLRRRRCRAVGLLADRELHGRDLLHLVDNDLLGDAPQLLVLAVAQLDHRHFDRALVMRGHHGHEIAVDVAGRLGRHVVHHLRHRRVDLAEKGALLGGHCRSGRVRLLRKRKRRHGKSDEKAKADDGGAETWSQASKFAARSSRDAANGWPAHAELPCGWLPGCDASACVLFRPYAHVFWLAAPATKKCRRNKEKARARSPIT